MPRKRLAAAWLILFASTASCVTVIPNTVECTAAGVMAAGAICAESLTGRTSEMTLDEYIEFLEPQPERPDPDRPGEMLPARAGAMCRSMADYERQKNALEQACRLLGRRCSKEIQAAVMVMKQEAKR